MAMTDFKFIRENMMYEVESFAKGLDSIDDYYKELVQFRLEIIEDRKGLPPESKRGLELDALLVDVTAVLNKVTPLYDLKQKVHTQLIGEIQSLETKLPK